MRVALEQEALPASLAACAIAPASSGENIGLHAVAAIARYYSEVK